jgi:Nucleoside-diphosphate-sugar epimerases
VNVLITGGYGFIGSHVAERFYKEGHKVFIIDNLSKGTSKNVIVRHKFYEMNIESSECEEVFSVNNFDVVVHLASLDNGIKSGVDLKLQAETNIVGLVNMLNLSVKYNIKRFIFASSTDVYGENAGLNMKENQEVQPSSAFGVSKYTGEVYCSKWQELFGLSTVALRISDVYGPRMFIEEYSNPIGIIFHKMLKGSPVTIDGNKKETRDFIYVEDLVDAVYRCIESDFTGIMNVSSNTSATLDECAETFKNFVKIDKVQDKEALQEGIVRNTIDNTIAKRELDWVPMYSLYEGLWKTYRWFSKEFERNTDTKQTEKSTEGTV